MEEEKKLLTISEAAAKLRVNKKTLRAWADKGHVGHIKTPSGYRLFDPDELDAFARGLRVEPTGKLAA